MRSLFLKVFLWFWLAMVLVIAALALASFATRPQREPRPPQFVEGIMTAYARSAIETYERDGSAALDSFERHMEHEVNVRARLFDSAGAELSGGDVTPDEQELASRVAQTGDGATKMSGGRVIEARPEHARDGGSYAFVAVLPIGPPPPQPGRRPPPHPPGPFGRFLPPTPLNFLLGESSTALALRLAAVILTAGVLCYMLARYIVSPVVKLREVTNRVAGGDLSARVSP
ncbi:MAG: hypothetical protein ACJ741_04650, partial [Pyrinomonadaceae bacterium]